MGDAKPARGRWLRRALWMMAGLLVLLAAAIGGLLLYFNDGYFKARLQETVKAQLGRDLELRALHVSFWNGSVTAEGVRLPNKDTTFKDKDTLRLERLTARVAVWPLLVSSGKRIEGLSVELEKPEIIIVRRGVWPEDASNIDDLIQLLTAGPPGTWPKQTGLQALGGAVAIHGGSVLYRDSDERIGTTRLKDLELSAKLGPLGQASEVKATFALATPDTEREGLAALDGRILWLQSDGSISPAAFQDIACTVQLKELDVAQITHHLRVRADVLDGKFQCTLGLPVTGTLKLEAPALANARLTATLETDGILAIREAGRRVAGQVPGRVELDVKGSMRLPPLDKRVAGASGGIIEVRSGRGALVVGATRAALERAGAKLLDLQASATKDGGAGDSYSFSLNARMDELCATDVGVVLGLKGRIGGIIAAKVDAAQQPDGSTKADGVFKTSEGYVMLGAVRQPTALDAGFSATITPDAQGHPEKADIVFQANADSFFVRSLQPVNITSLNNPQKLAAQARLQLHVGGREFWKQFGPLLEVLNMSTPLEEALDADLQITGAPGKVQVQLNGTLEQQAASAVPIRLVANADYDGAALVDQPTAPYLRFDARVSTADKGLFIGLAGTAMRGKDKQVIHVPEFSANGDLKAFTALNARFGSYVRVFLGPRYTVTGSIRQTGNSQLVQDLAADGMVTGTALTLATELKLAEFELRGPPLIANAPPLHWAESSASLQLGLGLKDSAAGSTLSVAPAKLTATALDLDGELAEADLGRLKTAANAKASALKLWLEALPAAKLNVQASAAAMKQLQVLGVLPGDPQEAGDLTLKAEHDPKARRVRIEALAFQSKNVSLKLQPTAVDTGALGPVAEATAFAFARLVPALPPLALEASVKAEALRGWQQKLGLPAEPLLAPGELTLRAQYDAKTQRAAIESLAFAGPDVNIRLTAPDIDLPALAALADQTAVTPAQWLQGAPQCSLEATASASAIQRLQALGLLPQNKALLGKVTVRGGYDRAARQVKFETLSCSGDAGDLTLSAVALSAEKLGAFLNAPKKDAAAAAALLPDFQLEMKTGTPLFAHLQASALLPDEFTLAGTLNAKARYSQAEDRLVIETIEFARDAKCNAPLITLSASGEVAAVRDLFVRPPSSAAQVMAHVDKSLTVKSLTVGLFELNCYLAKRKIAAQFAADSLAGIYEPKGLMTVRDLVLRPAGAPGVASASFSAQTPLEWHPAPAPGQPRSPDAQASLGGTWGVDANAPLRLNLNTGELALEGTLNLDAANVFYVVDKRFLTYNKPAGTPCKLRLDVRLSADNMLRAPAIELTGGAIGLSLANLVYNTAAPKPVVTLDKLALTGEPFAGTLSDFGLDMNRDALRLRFDCESFDVAKLATLGLKLPPAIQVSGSLNKTRALYEGALSAFPGGLAASTGLNVRLAGTTPGQNVALSLSGDLTADQTRVASRSLQAALDYAPAAGAASSQKLQCVLDATSRIPDAGVLDAAQKPGLPLLVRIANAQPAGPLDVTALVDGINALAAAWSPTPSAGPGDMSGIKRLRVEVSASAPVVLAGGMEIRNVQLPSVVLDDVKLTITEAKANVYGDGAVTIHKEVLDLATNAHDGSLELANIDLKTVTTDPAAPRAKDAYELLGRLSGSGSIAGTGFTKAALKTWQGAINAKVDGLTAQKNEGKSSGISPTKIATGLGGAILGGKTGRAMQLYGDDFGLFLNKLEFEPLPLTISVEKGRANIARTSLVGKGKSAGLQLDFLGGVNLVTTAFAPQMTIWLAKLPEKTQKELRLQQLDPADKQTLLAEFEQGKFQPVILTGNVRSPQTNADDVLKAFNTLDDRIEKLIQAKKARESGQQPADQQQPTQQQPAQQQPAQTPPPDKKKKDKPSLLDIFK